jgi:glycosyltransferase involved in cell wall biosynthesis
MERVIVFCARDWLHPKAGPVEHYMYEVFSRIARWGHYVLFVSHTHQIMRLRKRCSAEMEVVDGIQIARLGPRALFRMMSGMLLDRMHTTSNTVTAFDAVIECVTRRPMMLAEHTDTPVIPLVFDLPPRLRAAEDPPGPLIAASEAARRKLSRAGFHESFIVSAPYGADCSPRTSPGSRAETPTVAVFGRVSRVLKGGLARLNKEGVRMDVHVIGLGKSKRSRSGITCHGPLSSAERTRIYQRAWFGFCDAGQEHEALEMGACALPVLCSDADGASEYVEDDRTGFVLSDRDAAKRLAECLRKLTQDDALRKRLGTQGRLRAERQSWDRTAGLILATIENLPKPRQPSAPRSDTCLVRK